MKEYVAGFLFSDDEKKVVLILKNKPEWQKDKYNGVGGKVEPGELKNEAMIREFEEEAGLRINTWRKFCELRGNHEGSDYVVHFFVAFGRVDAVESKTDEPVWAFELKTVMGHESLIYNLNWLIPMALDRNRLSAVVVETSPLRG